MGYKKGYLRVVDESGEDYLYPESYFSVISLPPLPYPVWVRR
jgi:hypothetical protein